MTSISTSPAVPSTSRRRPLGGSPDAADLPLLVALRDIEHALGYRPYDSVTVRVVRKRRPFAIIRLDRPPGTDEGRTSAVGHTVVGMLGRIERVQWVDLVVFGPPGARRRVLPPGLAVTVRAVAEVLEAAGYRVVVRGAAVADDIATVDGIGRRRWVPLPPPPTGPADDGGGDVHHGSFVPIVPLDERHRTRALAALAELPPRGAAAGPTALDAVLRWRQALGAAPTLCSDAEAIALAWSLRSVPLRDVVLLQCAWGLDAGVMAVQRRFVTTEPETADGPTPAAPPDGLETAGSMDGPTLVASSGGPALANPSDGPALAATSDGRAPATENPSERSASASLASYWAVEREPRAAAVERAVELLRRVAACAPQSLSAPPLAMIAWLEWARGRSVVAAEYATAALVAEPDYRLAALVVGAVRTGLLPGWTRHV